MNEVDLRILARNVEEGEVDDLYTAIHTLGNEGFVEAKSVVEKFLVHPDPEVRYIALNVLTLHWGCQEHRSTCERLIRSEQDGDVRRMAITGLGSLLEGTRDARGLQILLALFSSETEDKLIREVAYSQILFVLGKSATLQPSAAKSLDFQKDVNWEFVKEARELVNQSGA